MSRGSGPSLAGEDEGNFSFLSLEIEPAPNPFGVDPIETIQSPETPHPNLHSRQRSENRQLLPESKEIFKYSTTTYFDFTGHQTVRDERYPRWSGEPNTLTRSRRESVQELALDLIIVIIALPFFALASAMIRVNGKPARDNQEQWFKQSAWTASTIFPLVFSLVLGRLAVKLSSYKIEQGTSLGLLERLMGSRSFFSTLITQFRLRPLTPLAVFLIFIWFLSPFGSQAILRSLSVETSSNGYETNVTYFNTRQSSFTDTGTWFPAFMALFSASILAPEQVKNSNLDLWGNVKVPLLSSFANTTNPDSDGWYTVSQTNTQYASLFGIPISLPRENSSALTIVSSYLQLSCHSILSNLTRTNGTFHNPGLMGTSGPFFSSASVSDNTSSAIGYLGVDTLPLLPPALSKSPNLDAASDKVQDDEEISGLLLYQDFTGLENVTSIYCTPSQTYAESEISCLEKNCRVIKMRSLKGDHPPSALTMLSFRTLFLAISSLLPLSTPKNAISNSRDEVDILQNYLVKPNDNAFIQTALPPSNFNEESRFLNLPLMDFETRLGAVMNAILQGSQGNLTSLLSGGSLSPDPNNATISTTSAQLTTQAIVFTVHWPWLSILLLATTSMLLSAIASAILHHNTLARDYLGFVSSLARESRHAKLPVGGANIDGLGRSKLLRKLKIKLGDVGDVQEGWQIGLGAALSVGKVGIGTGDGVASLDKRKLYV